jgi:hypothetical protein
LTDQFSARAESNECGLSVPATNFLLKTQKKAVMKRIMVRYKVKAEKAIENRRLIEAVFAEAQSKQLDGIRYATFVAADGVSFVHLFSNERADGSNPLGAMDAFKAFQANIRERCDEPPAAIDLEMIGSYQFFQSSRSI